MSFSSMHNDHLDPDRHNSQPEPPCEQCKWDIGNGCVLTGPCLYESNAVDEQVPAPALSTQVGGSHYKHMPIQPMEYSMLNHLDPCQHTIIKYVSRFREKGGIEDLQKAKHVIDMLIEFEGRMK